MKRVWLPLALAAFGFLLGVTPAGAVTCSVGGHFETGENFGATGSWVSANFTPGTVLGAPAGTHLLITEVAVRGCGTGAASDSSEFVEIYNPTTWPISLDRKYLSDDIGYYKVVNGPFAVANTSDFALRFPAGLTLSPGRTAVVCVTKAGFAGSGATAAAAQYFLEMRDSNGNLADDMVNVATGTTFPVTGGMFTNSSATNGEWVVLACWDGASDRVCDIDYASWGANSASNPKMDKSGISIDGPDAGAAASAFQPDIPAGFQTNLGSATVLAKPNTYQRTGGELDEDTVGGNGCVGIGAATAVDWLPVAGTSNIRFHLRFGNTDDDAMSAPITGQMMSQEFGVFLPDLGLIGSFNVPPMRPNSFFDVFFEVPLSSLPPAPQKIVPGQGPGLKTTLPATYGGIPHTNDTCPPDTNWAGNVDVQWVSTATGITGQVNKHYGDLLTCAGGAPSLIHVRPSNCTSPMPWSLVGVCPGFSVTLVNEDFSPAPNPIPVGWSGWISVTAAAGSVGTSCCFSLVFQCANATSAIDICSFACQCAPTPPSNPTPGTIGWSNVPGTTDVRFHVRWTNPSSSVATAPTTGQMMSQEFGVFAPDFGPIGTFNVPPIAPNSFFDVFMDVPLAQLPPSPPITGGPASNMVASAKGLPVSMTGPCPDDTTWAGNVDIVWNNAVGGGTVNYHFGDLHVCPGSGSTFIHVRPITCPSGAAAPWTITGLCPGFTATLVNEDYTPAPNPVPPGWSGYISVSAAAGTPVPASCCFDVTFTCDGVPGVINVCAVTCQCQTAPNPVPVIGWTTLPGTSTVQFQLHWTNPSTVTSAPVSGSMSSQEFGVFLPNAGPIGTFAVPPMAPNSFFDVFFEVPMSQLPPNPGTSGGPGPTGPCPPDRHWDGNVDVVWNGPGGPGQVNKHVGDITVCPGGGPSMIHIKSLLCASPLGMPWSISGSCPGFTIQLRNEDFSPAPNPVPPGWTGWIGVAAAAGTPVPDTCCFTVTFLCDGVPGVIDLCAYTCNCNGTPPNPTLGTVDWTQAPGSTFVKFHMRWNNPSTSVTTGAISGTMNSQVFGAFAPDFGSIGQFGVPPLQPNSFFDVFFDVPVAALPQEPQQILAGGGPQPGSPCPPDTSWSGNVDINWAGAGGVGQVNRHFTSLLVRPGFGSSHVHTLIFCNSAAGSPWTIAGLCPGFSATLLNEDFTPAPNPVPPNWTGWISVAATAATPAGVNCCFTVTFTCDGQAGVIDVCSETCVWPNTAVPAGGASVAFGIYATSPNPTQAGMMINFAMPKAGTARLDVYDLGGQRVRTLLDGNVDAGVNTLRWDGRGEGRRELPPGTYFLKLSSGERVASKKIVLVR